MGLHIINNNLQTAGFVLAIVGIVISIGATILRFVAAKLAARKPGLEDWMAVLAAVFYIFYTIPFLYVLVLLNGREIEQLDADELVVLTKTGYIMAAQYPPQQTFAKLSLVALYYRIFSSSRKFVLWLYTIGAVQLGWGIGNFIAHWAQCIPIRGFWDPSVPHVCLNDAMLLVVGETINSLLDFMLVGLAIWIVQSLQMSSAVKLKLSVIFALGGLAGVIGFVKIGFGFVHLSENVLAIYDLLWAMVQQGFSVICCCAPVYKPLFPSMHFYTRLRSLGSRIWRKLSGSNSEMQVKKLALDDLQLDLTRLEHGLDG